MVVSKLVVIVALVAAAVVAVWSSVAVWDDVSSQPFYRPITLSWLSCAACSVLDLL